MLTHTLAHVDLTGLEYSAHSTNDSQKLACEGRILNVEANLVPGNEDRYCGVFSIALQDSSDQGQPMCCDMEEAKWIIERVEDADNIGLSTRVTRM